VLPPKILVENAEEFDEIHEGKKNLGELTSVSSHPSKHEPIAGFDKFTFSATSSLIGSWIVHLVAGSQYAWGNMSPYIVSYYRNKGYDVSDS
jgi:hypothetical protein